VRLGAFLGHQDARSAARPSAVRMVPGLAPGHRNGDDFFDLAGSFRRTALFTDDFVEKDFHRNLDVAI